MDTERLNIVTVHLSFIEGYSLPEICAGRAVVFKGGGNNEGTLLYVRPLRKGIDIEMGLECDKAVCIGEWGGN